ncbi:hypothetical protein ACOCJ5_08070 [Knoellia sp. CPCC 206450]|uniref:hypothetical protein n=1 Tax=Knoellia tibetensis TaxID=3404798 RepID=UPI003B437D7B
MKRGTRRLALVAVTLAALLSGCSGGTPVPEPSPTLASPSAPADLGPLASFLDTTPTQPVATTPGRDDSSFSGAVFQVFRVETDARSTLVEWAATHPRTLAAGADFDLTLWQNFPQVTTKTHRYAVTTYQPASGPPRCVCSAVRAIRGEPLVQGALYPPLPADVTSVVLTSPWFEDVTVPVSRR